jgi:hypothetical protein
VLTEHEGAADESAGLHEGDRKSGFCIENDRRLKPGSLEQLRSLASGAFGIWNHETKGATRFA